MSNGGVWKLRLAAGWLRRGGIVAHAAEGVWGLACDPFNRAAVARLLALKQRSPAKGLILVADRPEPLFTLLAPLTLEERERLQAAWPGAVTWLVPAGARSPAAVRGRHRTLAVRVPGHQQLRALASAFGRPLVSTSANRSGLPPARSALKVRTYFGRRIDYLLPGVLGGRAGPSEIRSLREARIVRTAALQPPAAASGTPGSSQRPLGWNGARPRGAPSAPHEAAVDRYAVFGHPVAHSRSPAIHQAFAAQRSERIAYDAIDVPPERFAGALRKFFAAGGSGANVTVPHKAAAADVVERLEPRARRAAAVNTLVLQADGQLVGYNTDGPGLIRDLEHNLGQRLSDRRIVLLGAGGAAAGVVEAMLEAGPLSLVIANRTRARAEALAARFAAFERIAVRPFDALERADVVVNATTASLHGAVPVLPARLADAATLCYDMVYGDDVTAFMAWGRDIATARVADGFGMLVEQAAEAFALWRGWRPDTAPIIARRANQAPSGL